MLYGKLAEKFKSKTMLLVGIFVYIVICTVFTNEVNITELEEKNHLNVALAVATGIADVGVELKKPV